MSGGASTSSGGSRIATLARVLNVRLRFVFVMAVVGLIAAKWEMLANTWDRWRRPPAAAASAGSEQVEYFCPMHPSVVRTEPGSCPICGMPLSQRAKREAAALPSEVLARVQLTPLRMRLGGIGTSPVAYRLLSREIRAFGTIEHDETCEVRASARIRGRIEKLWVNFVGQQVARGDPLFSIYSPQLLVAQKEVLSARQALDQARSRGAASDMDQSLYDAARRKLELWGIEGSQIDALVRRGSAETTMTYYAPMAGIVVDKKISQGQYVSEGDPLYTIYDLSNVWLQARVFEDELAGVKLGAAVEVTSTAYPSEIFAGRITFIAFTLDPATRTLAARVSVVNPDYKLRPGMYATASIRLPAGEVTTLGQTASQASSEAAEPDARFAFGYYCPIYPDRLFDQPAHCPVDKFPMKYVRIEKVLAVPESAVIDTGTRQVVYRESAAGVFDMLAVTLGPRAGEFYPVLSGLAEGDNVATAGAFLVDAENRLNPGAAVQYFGASGK